MITNERQFRIARAEADRFAAALADADAEYENADPILRRAMREQIESQLADLRADLADYERLRSSGGTTLILRSLTQLPEALIWARIASGLSQRDLARRLGVSEQQVQRDESTGYARASFERLIAIARTLGVEAELSVTLPATEGIQDSDTGTGSYQRLEQTIEQAQVSTGQTQQQGGYAQSGAETAGGPAHTTGGRRE